MRSTIGRLSPASPARCSTIACARWTSASRPDVHGLPLMGTGDWNDGMSLVGAGGKGESVWLGWFLVSLLRPFADMVAQRGDRERADRYRRHASAVTSAVESSWDGEWYRRAYFDDGTPLGSKENTECQIDAIAQSWAALSDAGDPGRARQAMGSVDERLVRRKDRLVLLLTPPFDRMTPSPGTSRVISQAFGKTAVNTRMPRCGTCWRLRGSAMAIARPSCSRS